MAQLNTTVGNIQLKENMIITGATATDWASDSKYPSAKAVADKISAIAPGKIEHPVGSVLITSENVNPGASVGGTWELIDKEYKTVVETVMSGWDGWTMAMTGSSPSGAVPGGWIARADHTICLKLYFTTQVEIDGNNTSLYHKLGDLSRPKSGASEGGFPLTNHYGMAYAVDTAKNTYLVGYYLDGSGAFYVNSIYDKKKLPAQSQIQIHLILNMSISTMLDGVCDKFYWKRKS